MNTRISIIHVTGALIIVPFLVSLALVATGKSVFLRIKSSSMHPNFCEGDIALVKVRKSPRSSPALSVGQVIVFTGPKNNILIKRIAGTPSDRIEYSSHSVLRNGQVPYTNQVCTEAREHVEPRGLVVPVRSVFAVGDNWNESEDSRQFGSIPETSIIGKVVMRIPLNIGSCSCGSRR